MTLPIAVIIPCYNDGATVRDAVTSALRDGPQEVIVVDDGSTDPATAGVLAELAHDGGVTVVRRENGGLSAARMTGVDHSHSEFIMPLDADDLIAPGAIARLTRALQDAPDASVAYGDLQAFGSLRGSFRCAWGWDPWVITHMNLIPGPGAVIRRQHLREDGGWVLRHGYEDWDLWMSMIENGRRAVYSPGPALMYRQGDGRMLSGSRLMHDEIFRGMRERHPLLFAERAAHRARSIAPLRVRLTMRALEAIPSLGDSTANRIAGVSARPGRAISVLAQRVWNRIRRR